MCGLWNGISSSEFINTICEFVLVYGWSLTTKTVIVVTTAQERILFFCSSLLLKLKNDFTLCPTVYGCVCVCDNKLGLKF